GFGWLGVEAASEFQCIAAQSFAAFGNQFPELREFVGEGRIPAFLLKTRPKKIEVVFATKQFAEDLRVVRHLFQNHAVERLQNAQLVPNVFNSFAPLMEIFRHRVGNCLGEPPLPAFINLGDRAANLLPIQAIQLPLHQTCFDAFQLWYRFLLPASKCRGKALAFEQQQFLGARKEWLLGFFRCPIAQLSERLQSHLRITQIRNQSSDLAHRTILASVAILADRTGRKPHCRPQLFKMLAHFVHRDTAFFGGILTQLNGGIGLFAKNSLQSFRQRFAQFQTEGHGVFYVIASRTLLYRFSPVTSRPNHQGALNVRQLPLSAHSTSATPSPASLPRQISISIITLFQGISERPFRNLLPAVPGQSAANCFGLSLISRSSRWLPRPTLNVNDAVLPVFRRRTCRPADSVAR